jgi:hypothetical protein
MSQIKIGFVHCVQTDPAKNVWTRAYLIPERNRTVTRQEESKNSVYLFLQPVSIVTIIVMINTH